MKMAEKAGKRGLAAVYARRAGKYKNLYDKQSVFVRPRFSDGSWQKNFDPLKTEGQGFIEGNV